MTPLIKGAVGVSLRVACRPLLAFVHSASGDLLGRDRRCGRTIRRLSISSASLTLRSRSSTHSAAASSIPSPSASAATGDRAGEQDLGGLRLAAPRVHDAERVDVLPAPPTRTPGGDKLRRSPTSCTPTRPFSVTRGRRGDRPPPVHSPCFRPSSFQTPGSATISARPTRPIAAACSRSSSAAASLIRSTRSSESLMDQTASSSGQPNLSAQTIATGVSPDPDGDGD